MTQQYTMEDVKAQVKPLSDNAFLAFFQRLWRAWLGVWYGFADKHPKLAKIIYQVFFFIVFSEGVTIFQILVLIFLPQLFGLELAGIEFMWPKVNMGFELNGEPVYWAIFGNMVLTDEAGNVIIGGGLGYFLAFKIATFLAQCINFPLQRNITYKSKGNPWWQAMWYFIGWVGINAVCDGINNLWIPFANAFFPANIMWIKDILAMVAQGGVAMVIFFFIFMVIFPDLDKMAANAEKKVEKLKAANAPAEKIADAEAKAADLKARAEVENARKNEISANTIANTKALSWEASVKLLETMKADSAKYTAEQVATQEKVVEEKYQQALEATVNKYAAAEAYAALKA